MFEQDVSDQQLDELLFWRGHLMLIVTSYAGQSEQLMPAPPHLRPTLLRGPLPFIREGTQDELVQYLKDHPLLLRLDNALGTHAQRQRDRRRSRAVADYPNVRHNPPYRTRQGVRFVTGSCRSWPSP